MQPVPDEHPSRPRATDPPRQQVTHTVPVPVHEHLVAPEAPPHYFVGRANEVKELAARLAAGKPVAIQGMGGIGKTALAQRLVQEVQGQFAGGVLWTTFLTPDTLQEPPDVLGILNQWAEAAGGSPVGSSDLKARADGVRTLLAGRGRILAVLDSAWEYGSVDLLVRKALPPEAVVLITTRDADMAKRLGLRVEPLGVMPEDDAVALFRELLGDLGTHEQAAREVARLVGGLPLALEIAAGMADMPSDLVEIALKLRTAPMLEVLESGRRDDPQHSVRASLSLSYGELNARMQRRFRALGAFAPAPFDAAAAQAVWGEGSAEVAAERANQALRFLARRALLTRVSGDTYSQHDLLRAYALAMLKREGEAPTVRRHAAHYQTLAACGDWQAIEHAFEQVRHGWESTKGCERDAIEYFMAARRFLERRRWAEYLEWGSHALACARRIEDTETEGELLNGLGYTYWKEARYPEALSCLDDCLEVLRTSPNARIEASCINRIGLVHREQNRWADALDFFGRSLAIQRQIANEIGEGYVIHNVGLTLLLHARFDEAQRQLRCSIDVLKRVAERPANSANHEDTEQALEGWALALNTLGRVHFARGQLDEAMGFWQESLQLAKRIGDRAGMSRTPYNIGRVQLARGELDGASDSFRESLDISREIGHRRAEARALNGMGGVCVLRKQYAQAHVNCQQALTIDREIGDRRQEATVLSTIGTIHLSQGAYALALEHYQCSLDVVRTIDDRLGEAVALSNLGRIYGKLGRASEGDAARAQAEVIIDRLGIEGSAALD